MHIYIRNASKRDRAKGAAPRGFFDDSLPAIGMRIGWGRAWKLPRSLMGGGKYRQGKRSRGTKVGTEVKAGCVGEYARACWDMMCVCVYVRHETHLLQSHVVPLT